MREPAKVLNFRKDSYKNPRNFTPSAGPSTSSGTARGPTLLVLIYIHRVLVVVGAVEVDDDTKRRATLTSSPPRLLSLIPYQHFQ